MSNCAYNRNPHQQYQWDHFSPNRMSRCWIRLQNGCPRFVKHLVLHGPVLPTSGGQRAFSCNHVGHGRGHRLIFLEQHWTGRVGWRCVLLGQVGDTRWIVGICWPLCSVLRWRGVWTFVSPSLPGCTCGGGRNQFVCHTVFSYALLEGCSCHVVQLVVFESQVGHLHTMYYSLVHRYIISPSVLFFISLQKM